MFAKSLNIRRIVYAVIGVICAMAGESAMAQLPHDFRSEQIALCLQQVSCEPGDTVTVQGQVTCLAANRVEPYSKYLYIELIAPNDSVVVRQKIACKNRGAFAAALPVDPLGAYGVYYVRAYTKLMRNFAPESFAVQPLLVGQSFPDFDNITTDGLKCVIVPHGGHLCSGAPHNSGTLQNVTIRLANYLDDPLCNIPLALTNENGDTIASQRTSLSGLAMMSFVPQTEAKYFVNLVYEGVNKAFPVQECNDALPVIHASLRGSQVAFSIKGGTANLQQLQMYAFDRTNGVSHIAISRAEGTFKLANAPQMITLFLTDDKCSPLAQCTVVARCDESPQLSLPQTAVAGQSLALPTFGDDTKVMARLLPMNVRWAEHAESQIYYLSDLRSPLPFPEHYFTLSEHERNAELMAWVGTASFKRFDIARAVKQDSAIYTFMPEDVMYFEGKVETPSKKPFNKGSLVAFNTDNNGVYDADLNKDGEFVIAVDDFYDGTQFYLQAVNTKNKPESMYVKIKDETFPAPSLDRRYSLGNSLYASSEVTYKGGNWNRQELPEITVKARTKYDNLHSTQRFYGQSYKDRTAIEERGFLTLYDILKDIPGITIRKIAAGEDEDPNAFDDMLYGGNSNDVKNNLLKLDYAIYPSRGISSLGGGTQVVMLIDGKRTHEPLISLLEMSSFEIESVEYLRPWQAITYTFGASNGAINVITRGYQKPANVKSKGAIYTPMGLSTAPEISLLVAETPGKYRLFVDVVSPSGIQSYETVVNVVAK